MFYLKGGTVILGHDAAETRIYDRVFCCGAWGQRLLQESVAAILRARVRSRVRVCVCCVVRGDSHAVEGAHARMFTRRLAKGCHAGPQTQRSRFKATRTKLEGRSRRRPTRGAEVAPPTQGTRARAARTWLSARSRFVEGLIAKQRPEQDSKVLPDPSTEELKVGREPPHTAHTHAHARTQRRPPPNAMLRTCYDTWTRAQGSEGERERERGAEDRVAFVRVDVFSMNERRTDWGRERRDHRWRLA